MTKQDMIELNKAANTKHVYDVGTDNGIITVHANARGQARKIAEKEGYCVRDVNMVG